VACLTPLDDKGFIVDEAEVIYWGQCPACSAQEVSGSQPVITAFSPKPNSGRNTRG
jgi:hypothetical protein